ncbi:MULTISPECIES: RrF2 family transcriptional regulator [Maribacter]|uniref:Rrf2 family transcriptional regulator n=2 Tax=Maribacter TaxID=252356 RepID=A0A5R8M9H9_9FLAO|nr:MULTISPECIES: Rrf2 family transcriptional regulator [Maribacter]KAA2219016.1 Rrf2 family transcriptional regulator [Maribacter flavus]TLF46242.1 Rrf2 family transcriptional regulator [Maribacter aurantiacus]
MLSNSSKYAINAVLYVAVNSSIENKILAKDISRETQIPQAYLSKLMQELTRHNLISSVRGPNGGFYLTDENRGVSLLQIVNVIDGDNRLTSCMLGLHACDHQHPCAVHHLVGDTKTRFVENLEKTTVQDLVSDIKSGKSFLGI